MLLSLSVVTTLVLLFQIDERSRDTHRAVNEIREVVRRLNANATNEP